MRRWIAASFALIVAGSAHGATVVTENFDGVATGFYSAPATVGNLNLTQGTIDLFANGGFGLPCAGGLGNCIDVDGQNGPGGTRLSTNGFAANAGDTLTITVDVAGSQRGSTETFFAGFNNGTTDVSNQSITVQSADPYSTRTFSFIAPVAGTYSAFFGTPSADNVGPLADNFSFSISPTVGGVPEPGVWAMMLAGFGLLGAAARARRTVRLA